MLLLSEEITLSAAQFDILEAFEIKHYKSSPYREFMVKEIEATGFLPIGAVTVDFVTIHPKEDKLHFQLTDEEGTTFSNEIDVKENGPYYPLYILTMTAAPAIKALHGEHGIDHVYAFASMLSARIVVGDASTYPKYVPQLLPKHVDNFEYDTEDAQMLAMRFTHIGEQRTTHNLLRTPAIVRYVVESSEKSENNGFSEIYPVVMHGNIVEFNGVIQFPHELHIPVDSDTDSHIAKELGTTFIDSVTACETGDVCWMDTVSGKKRPVQ